MHWLSGERLSIYYDCFISYWTKWSACYFALRHHTKYHATYCARHLTFFSFQLVLISWMVTLSSCLIWQIISFILSPNEFGCVYASLSGPAIDLQKMPILPKKNHLFRWSQFWYWRVCKQAKLSHLKTRTHTLKSPLLMYKIKLTHTTWAVREARS